jgi:hypothetical protein
LLRHPSRAVPFGREVHPGDQLRCALGRDPIFDEDVISADVRRQDGPLRLFAHDGQSAAPDVDGRFVDDPTRRAVPAFHDSLGSLSGRPILRPTDRGSDVT